MISIETIKYYYELLFTPKYISGDYWRNKEMSERINNDKNGRLF